MNTKIWWWE